MNKILALGAFALTLSAAPAMAQPFSGPYVGAEIALDNYEIKGSDVFTSGDEYDGISGNGLNGGVFAGYDLPLGTNMFGGVEVNLNTSGAKVTYDDTVDDLTLKAKHTFSASARLGTMLNDSTGLYARAGWANSKFKSNVNGTRDSDLENALVLGAGVETRAGESTSLRLEYTYADYDDNLKNNQIRAGISYHF